MESLIWFIPSKLYVSIQIFTNVDPPCWLQTVVQEGWDNSCLTYVHFNTKIQNSQAEAETLEQGSVW